MTRLGWRSAVLDQNVFPAREIGRFGVHAETDRGVVWARFNPASRKAIPPHRLYCCSGALRALSSLGVCMPVCLHSKTWLPSATLQACQTLIETRSFLYIFFQLIRNFVQLPVPSIDRKLFLSFDIHPPSWVSQTRILLVGGWGHCPRGQPHLPSVAC